MKKGRFIIRFLLGFALLLAVWKVTGVARWYVAGLLHVAGALGPQLIGWSLQVPGGSAMPVWVHGNVRVDLAIQFDVLAISVVPLLALIFATPGLGVRGSALRMLGGSALCFLVDTLIIVLFPLLVYYKNPFTDILGTFVGLITFVGAPVIIWFIVTFSELRRWLPSLQRQPRR